MIKKIKFKINVICRSALPLIFIISFIVPLLITCKKASTPEEYTVGDRIGISSVDKILKQMDLGSIAFNTPHSMNIEDKIILHLLLSSKMSPDELKRQLEFQGEKTGEIIRISNRMEARLSGQNFSIIAITPEIQAVSRNETTEWKWEVLPAKSGDQYLHLTISAIINIDGDETHRVIRTFDRTIKVTVTSLQKTKNFIQDNWQWLWVTLVPPLPFFWNFLKKRKGHVQPSV